MSSSRSGLYVTVEGIDGAGKTTLVEELGDRLSADTTGPEPVQTAEPCEDLWTGRAVREAIEREADVRTDVLLFAADRAEHLGRVVGPALEEGRTVVSDRGHDSTYAYQVPRLVAEGMEVPEARSWLDAVYHGWNRTPDVTLWVDVSVDTALGRMSGEEKWADRAHLERVRSNYEARHDMDTGRIQRIDGEREPDQVLADALGALP